MKILHILAFSLLALPSLNGCAVPSDSAATGTAPMVEESNMNSRWNK